MRAAGSVGTEPWRGCLTCTHTVAWDSPGGPEARGGQWGQDWAQDGGTGTCSGSLACLPVPGAQFSDICAKTATCQ